MVRIRVNPSDNTNVETNLLVATPRTELNAELAEGASFSFVFCARSAFQNPGAARVSEIFLSKIFLPGMSGSKGREDRKIKDRKLFSAWASRLRSLVSRRSPAKRPKAGGTAEIRRTQRKPTPCSALGRWGSLRCKQLGREKSAAIIPLGCGSAPFGRVSLSFQVRKRPDAPAGRFRRKINFAKNLSGPQPEWQPRCAVLAEKLR